VPKIVINTDYGGFAISFDGAERMAELGCPVAERKLKEYDEQEGDYWCWHGTEIHRHNPILIEVVEDIGLEASDTAARLEVVKINSKQYYLENCDGLESVMTPKSISWITIGEDEDE
tara:strand:+ start:8994 stop:9344 length:351 start_codon:yes stop_codon:yes gene_type:complete